MTKPCYQEIPSTKIPTVQNKDGTVRVKVIAGHSMGKKAVIDTKIPIMYLYFSLKPDAKITQEILNNFNTFAYDFQGWVY